MVKALKQHNVLAYIELFFRVVVKSKISFQARMTFMKLQNTLTQIGPLDFLYPFISVLRKVCVYHAQRAIWLILLLEVHSLIRNQFADFCSITKSYATIKIILRCIINYS